MTTLYDILGVSPSASADAIKAAYRKAAMRWHPDRNLDKQAEAERRFKELAHAYAVLSDAARRKDYDQSSNNQEAASGEDEEAAAGVFFKAMFELAQELAQRGHNRDVLFGAMLSQGCPEGVARAIADQVATARAAAARARASPSPSQPPSASAGSPATSPSPPDHRGSDSTWRNAVLIIAVSLAIVWFAVTSSGPGVAQQASVERPSPVSTASAPEPQASASAPQTELALLLPANVTSFDERTKSGLVTYEDLPSSHGIETYKLSLIQTLSVGGDTVLFFASTPANFDDKDGFTCHACTPLLSAMLVTKTAQGLVLKLPLQVIGPMGAWGHIDLSGELLPKTAKVAPEKLAVLIPFGDMAQGDISQWVRLLSIEKTGFKSLGDLVVLEDGMSSLGCEMSPAACKRVALKHRFIKGSRTNGYYDIAVTAEVSTKEGGVVHQVVTTSVMRFDGEKYVGPAAPPEPQAQPGTGTDAPPTSSDSASSPT